MDRLFLDANVLFSAAYSANAGLLQFWKLKNVVLCSSRYALEEAAINLAQEVQKRRLEKLAAAIEFFEPTSRSLPQDLTLPVRMLLVGERLSCDIGEMLGKITQSTLAINKGWLFATGNTETH
jgi:hypothetical protein